MRVYLSKSNVSWALLALLWLTASGCKTFNGLPEKNLAAVTITNRPAGDVQSAVGKIFRAHGFSGGLIDDNNFEFTRKGTRMDHLLYGSYVFEDTVTMKVTVTEQSQPNGDIRLGCQAWLVEADTDPVFEDDHQAHPLRKGPYQDLLKEIKKALGE